MCVGGMSTRSSVLGAATVCVLAFIVGCSGRTASGPSDDGGTASDGGACVDISASDYDTSCHTAADCITITAGRICDGTCFCGGTTINASGKAAYADATQGIQGGQCACGFEGAPQCIGGTCTLCTGAPNDPPGCNIEVDAATGEQDSGADVDASCIDIVVTPDDVTCTSAADCTLGPSGSVCTGACDCGGTPMNVAAAKSLGSLAAPYATGQCPCIAPAELLQCVQGTCMACTPLEDGGFTGCTGG